MATSQPVFHRRLFLTAAAAAGAGAASGLEAPPAGDAVAGLTVETLRGGGEGKPVWFHPRACMIPGPRGPKAFMTLQEIQGSDYFGPVCWTESEDLGKTWSDPQPAPPLGRIATDDGRGEEAVCDVVPEYHAPTKSVLAMGHDVYYKGPRFSADQPPRRPVYAVFRDGRWGERKRLAWDDPRGASIYTCGCGQRLVLEGGDVLLALSFGVAGKPRSVAGARCTFDGGTLAVKEVGEPLSHARGRGLLEPSLARVKGRFYMTIRAEDGRGYVSTSDDGLKWAPQRAWAWDDGAPLETGTTQQHWLPRRDGLFLVYTRKDASNANVFRWRAPLYLARVDVASLQLVRETERVVFPLVGDGVAEPDAVPLTDNFHVNAASADESWITVGRWRPKQLRLGGDLLLARVRWTRPDAAPTR